MIPLNEVYAGRSPNGQRLWLSEAAYIVFGTAIGAAALYIGLVTMLVGCIPIAIGARYLWRQAPAYRLPFIGGSMLGIGLCAWPTLGQAITNEDPAVHYDPSTVPVLITALVVGAIGLVVIVLGIVRARRHGPA